MIYLPHRRRFHSVNNSPGTTDLAHWWEFESEWPDSHASANFGANGTVTNPAGKVGSGSAKAVGSSNYLNAPGVSDSFHISDYTIALWAQNGDTTANNHLFAQYGTTESSYHWALQHLGASTDEFRFLHRAGGVSYLVASDSAYTAEDTWYHLALVRRSSDMELWVDGVKQTGSATISGTENTGSSDLWLNRVGNSYGDTQVDEACIYTRALSSDEVGWLYNSGNGRAYADL